MKENSNKTILTPSQLNRTAKQLLEDAFPLIWVEGELSNLARPASGHIYFSLKDAHAQIRCALFKPRSTWLKFRPEDGDQVLARGKISLYEVRGEYQLIAEHLEPAGEGALRREYERLKAKLAAEGLFAEERKRAIPPYPRRIGVVTSASGAALKDVLKVLGRRWPLAPVRVYPTQVQGLNVGPEITAAIDRAISEAACDVLIVTRGGGSLEDLWCFNDEQVVRAVAGCPIPVISAVGHEIDITLVDFAADLRAPTPSAAAELASPSQREVRARLADWRLRLRQCMDSRLREQTQSVDWLARHLRAQHPRNALGRIDERLADLQRRLASAAKAQVDDARRRLELARTRLAAQRPGRALEEYRRRVESLRTHLSQAVMRQQREWEQRLERTRKLLDLVSPEQLLLKGFAILERTDGGQVIRSVDSVRKGERFIARVADGRIVARVDDLTPDP